MPNEGPSLKVVWSLAGHPTVLSATRYYPLPKCSMVMAEDHALFWFRQRGVVIRAMEWSWGDVPRGIPKSRFIPVPVGRPCV